MGKKKETTYKCKYCKDLKMIRSVGADGTEYYGVCYCHDLVQSGKLKAGDGAYAIERLQNRQAMKKRNYTVGD